MTTRKDATGERITGKDAPPAVPALLDVEAVAAMLGCSRRTVYRLSDGGLMPSPLRVGSLLRWRRSEVCDWIADRCPSVRPAKGGER